MDAPVTITITINQMTPVIEAAVEALLKAAGKEEGATVEAPATGSRSLEQIWLTDDAVQSYARERGIRPSNTVRAVHVIARTAYACSSRDEPGADHDFLRWFPIQLARTDARNTGGGALINAADFVRLMASISVRQALLDHGTNYGPMSNDCAEALAEHLKSKFGRR